MNYPAASSGVSKTKNRKKERRKRRGIKPCLRLKAVSHPNIKIFWQPPHKCTLVRKLAGLQAVLPYLLNIHVFHWHVDDQTPPAYTRLPLAQGKEDWAAYINALQTSKRDHFLSLEFVQNDDPDNFLKDAAVLLDLLQGDGTVLQAAQ